MPDQPQPQQSQQPRPAAAQPVGPTVLETSPQAAPSVPAGVAPATMAPPPPAAAVHGPDGRLSLEAMRAVHRAGSSVIYKGRVIPPGSPLPDAAELSGGDAAALDAAEADLDRREQSIAAERARIATARRHGDRAGKAADAGQRVGQQPPGPAKK